MSPGSDLIRIVVIDRSATSSGRMPTARTADCSWVLLMTSTSMNEAGRAGVARQASQIGGALRAVGQPRHFVDPPCHLVQVDLHHHEGCEVLQQHYVLRGELSWPCIDHAQAAQRMARGQLKRYAGVGADAGAPVTRRLLANRGSSSASSITKALDASMVWLQKESLRAVSGSSMPTRD